MELMKNTIFRFFALCIIFLLSCNISKTKIEDNILSEEKAILSNGFSEETELNKGYIPKEGFVPNEETAIKIAVAIWTPIYGNSINKNKPFIAVLNEKDDCWEVRGTLPKYMHGGVPEIKISKSDGKILYVCHGK